MFYNNKKKKHNESEIIFFFPLSFCRNINILTLLNKEEDKTIMKRPFFLSQLFTLYLFVYFYFFF